MGVCLADITKAGTRGGGGRDIFTEDKEAPRGLYCALRGAYQTLKLR